MSLLKTPLYRCHMELGAVMKDFAYWEMPIEYEGIIQEHESVRSHVGIFDVSHMAKITVEGIDAANLLEKLVAKEVSNKPLNVICGPTAFLNEKGGFKDDVMVYRLKEEKFIVIGNALNRGKDLEWLMNWAKEGSLKVSIKDETLNIAMLSLQGPSSPKLIRELSKGGLESLKPLKFITDVNIAEVECLLLSRSGWTGEDGFEIMTYASQAEALWTALIKKGAKPCGLGSRNTLRMEAGFCLYGYEVNEDITPLEARYWVFTFSKPSYIGREALWSIYNKGVERIRVGVRMVKGAPTPRQGCQVYMGEKRIGAITSGSYSPTLKRGIGMAYIDIHHAILGAKVKVEVRGKIYEAKIQEFPFKANRGFMR